MDVDPTLEKGIKEVEAETTSAAGRGRAALGDQPLLQEVKGNSR